MPKRKRIIIIIAIVLAVLALAAWIASMILRPSYETPAELSSAAKAQAALTGGAKAYVARCAYCHDTGYAPSIAGRDLDAAAMTSFVRAGVGNMPAFPPSQVSDAELAQIADYAAKLPVQEPKP